MLQISYLGSRLSLLQLDGPSPYHDYLLLTDERDHVFPALKACAEVAGVRCEPHSSAHPDLRNLDLAESLLFPGLIARHPEIGGT